MGAAGRAGSIEAGNARPANKADAAIMSELQSARFSNRPKEVRQVARVLQPERDG